MNRNPNDKWLMWCWMALAVFILSVWIGGCSKNDKQDYSRFHGEPQPKEWHPKKVNK